MKKFFQILKSLVMLLVVVGALVSVGCMTHYANIRTYRSSSGPTSDGGWTSYSKTETYSYDSGYREYYGGPVIRHYDPYYYQPLAPSTTRYYQIPSPLPKWHNIPNPIQGDRFEKPQKQQQQCEPPHGGHPSGGHEGGGHRRR